MLCGDVAQVWIAEEAADEGGQFLQASKRGDDLAFEVVLAGNAGLADAVMVKSARGAVSVFRPVRFPGPFPAPGVPLSEHRALHKSRCVACVLSSCLAGPG